MKLSSAILTKQTWPMRIYHNFSVYLAYTAGGIICAEAEVLVAKTSGKATREKG